MKLYLLFISWAFFSCAGSEKIKNCNDANSPHGSLIIAAICEDGIVMVSDLRASFTAVSFDTGKEEIYAYYDGCKKIFKIGKFHIGISGTTNVGNTYWEDVIAKYNKTNPKDTMLETTFSNFKKYLNKSFKNCDSTINQCVFILGGYENGIPKILVSQPFSNIIQTTKVGHRLYSDGCVKGYFIPPVKFTSTDFITAASIAFDKCSAANLAISNEHDIFKIIRDNSANKLNKSTYVKYNTVKDLENAILKEEVPVKYVWPEAKKLLERKHIKVAKEQSLIPTCLRFYPFWDYVCRINKFQRIIKKARF